MREIQQTSGVIEQGIRDGLHVGAQLFAMIDGAVVADVVMGLARGGGDGGQQDVRVTANQEIGDPRVPMQTDTLMLWLSAGKPVTAAGILRLWEEGKVGLEEPVAAHVPAFGVEGKEAITLRHLLTHTAGIRAVDASYPFETW